MSELSTNLKTANSLDPPIALTGSWHDHHMNRQVPDSQQDSRFEDFAQPKAREGN